MEISLEKLKRKVKTFDLIFFRGPEITSKTISFTMSLELKKSNKALYSHLGLVILGKDFPYYHKYYSPDKIYIWESTLSWNRLGDGIKDVDGKRSFGVQLRDLEEVIDKNCGLTTTSVAWCKLKKPCIIDPYKLANVFKKHQGKTYEINIFNLLAAVFPCLRKYRKSVHKMCCCCKTDQSTYVFCSELVAIVYKEFGILNKHVKPENVIPPDFISFNGKETFDEDNEIPVLLDIPCRIFV